MKPASEMTSDDLNREIARLRGELWTQITADGTPGAYRAQRERYPDYLLWVNAGPLWGELIDNIGFEPAVKHLCELAESMALLGLLGDKPMSAWITDAIRHAYYEWKRGKDADTE